MSPNELLTCNIEHTLLVTEDGVENLTARLPDSPGGPVPMPEPKDTPTAIDGTPLSVDVVS